jgi:hypothetical protein
MSQKTGRRHGRERETKGIDKKEKDINKGKYRKNKMEREER